MDMDSRFLRVNESLCEMFGRPEEELVGIDFGRVHAP